MRKSFESIIVIPLLMLASVGCSRVEMDQQQEGAYKYSFVLDDNTRAVIGDTNVEWVEGDEVGMFVGDYKGSAKVDVTTSPKTVVFYSESAIPAGTKAYAWFPYDPEDGESVPEKTKISLSNTQNGYQTSAMPLASVPFDVEEETGSETGEGNGQIRFLNLGSLINFKIWSSVFDYRLETVKSVRIDASAPIAGVGYIDLTAVSEEDESTLKLVTDAKNAPTNSVRVDEKVPVAVSRDDAEPIKMVVFPGTFKATLTVTTNAAEYTKEIPEFTFARSHSRTFVVDLATAKRSEDEAVASLKVDELTIEWLKINPALIGPTYKQWAGMPGSASNAVYAGYTASGNSSLQFNDDYNAGIVTTKSGGKVRRVSAIWNGSTANGRSLAIYVSHTPFKSADDLYSTSTQGTLLGHLSMGWPATDFYIEDDWEYVGLRSYDKTLYITEIDIAWEE
ncbi:MAG: hypothetical protein IJP49_02945 [Bacteroidales bacterium]|nr:hypothetical protein [Bacteroidales bacterium]